MDCIEAKEKINLYVDDQLSEEDIHRLIWHTSVCPQCKKALDEAVCLKQALGRLGEVEPPAGITASAVMKAKKRRFPVFAYASAAAAAVIALLLIMSPGLLTGNKGTAENADGKLMSAQAAAGEEYAMDSAVSEEARSAAEQDEGVQAAAPEIGMESAAAYTGEGQEVYGNEEAFYAANSRAETPKRLTLLYRPEKLPEGAALLQLEVSSDAVCWVYALSDGQTMTMEWLRTKTADDIAEWRGNIELSSDLPAHSFQFSGERFWSAQARINGAGEAEAADDSMIHAYWAQDGAAFHAEFPATFTQDDIEQYCSMELVPLG